MCNHRVEKHPVDIGGLFKISDVDKSVERVILGEVIVRVQIQVCLETSSYLCLIKK
jgi:hypothetical protein